MARTQAARIVARDHTWDFACLQLRLETRQARWQDWCDSTESYEAGWLVIPLAFQPGYILAARPSLTRRPP